jgi:acetolactate synthase I/II/III large subunit
MPQNNEYLSGSDILVQVLVEKGVKKIFAITGAGNLAIIDAIAREGSIRLLYAHHEQAAVMEAQGYARVTGEIGVALVTTGGGSSNVTTGILSAHLDSIPILLISGNESSFHCANPYNLRAYGVQGFNSIESLKPITKLAFRIKSVSDVAATIQDSIELALENRMGPVHIDFPMDLQRKAVGQQSELIAKKKPQVEINKKSFYELITDLKNSKSPLIYFGNGIRNAKSTELAKRLIRDLRIPYLVSWSAIDIFPESDNLNVGRVGIYGDRHANILLQKSDLLVAIGTRLAIPQLGYDKTDFGRKAKKWVIEIDSTECAKFEDLGWKILNNDAGQVLENLTHELNSPLNLEVWRTDCISMKKEFPRIEQLGPPPANESTQIHSGVVLSYLNSVLKPDALVVTDVGAALLNGHYLYEQQGDRRFFTSQGLGEMGFGLPAAIGAHFADPSKQLVCLNTDGAIMFNLQELQVVAEHKIAMKLFIFNNSGYSMIRISQENLFEGRLEGSTIDSGVSFPEFEDIAKAFGFKHVKIRNKNDLELIDKSLVSPYPELIEVIMDPEQKYFPRLATNKLPDGTLVSPPIEDLDPKISIELLEDMLGYRPHENSFKARGLA